MNIWEQKREIEKLLARRHELSGQKEGSNDADYLNYFKEMDSIHTELKSRFAQLAKLAEDKKEFGDASIALANLSSLLASSDAEAALNAARRFRSLPSQATGVVTALLEDALAVVYAERGEMIRSKQHRAIALQLRQRERAANDEDEDGSGWLWTDLAAGLRYFGAQQAPPARYAITLADNQNLFEWLASRRTISTDDASPSIGQFVTNDRGFYREALDRLEMLTGRLMRHLNKPDNYLLVADPGSGKSFFVRQFKKELEKRVGSDIEFLERNMSAYDGIDAAFFDIIIDVMIALTTHRPVLLFIDEVDTQIDDKNIFQRLIAPMNGDPFFFSQKQVSFAKQNLVIFYALSSKIDENRQPQKWPDFLSRIPSVHQITLPTFDSPFERIYRTVSMLPVGTAPVKLVEAAALAYIGQRNWNSARELEHAVELAKARISESPRVLELTHIAPSWQDVEAVSDSIFGAPMNVIEIENASSNTVRGEKTHGRSSPRGGKRRRP